MNLFFVFSIFSLFLDVSCLSFLFFFVCVCSVIFVLFVVVGLCFKFTCNMRLFVFVRGGGYTPMYWWPNGKEETGSAASAVRSMGQCATSCGHALGRMGFLIPSGKAKALTR